MKELLLHVGFGKTGSSALQSWFAHNREALAAIGICYADPPKESLEFRTSAGNGVNFLKFINGAGDLSADDVYAAYFNDALPRAIISSEVIGLTEESLRRLLGFCRDRGITLRVIAFVRNLYDHCYADYVQRIKRFNLDMDFREFARTEYVAYHIIRAEFLLDHVDNVDFVLYEDVRSDVAKAFCDMAGIPYGTATGKIDKRTVNRSLASDEIAVLRFFNRMRRQNRGVGLMVSTIISEHLIDNDPGRVVDRPWDGVVVRDLTERYGDVMAVLRARTGLGNWTVSHDSSGSEPLISPEIDPALFSEAVNALAENADAFPANTQKWLMLMLCGVGEAPALVMARGIASQDGSARARAEILIDCASAVREKQPDTAAGILRLVRDLA